MNVVLPNGKTISGIPDGTSREEIREKAIRSGIALAEDFNLSSSIPDQRVDESFKANLNGTIPATFSASDIPELDAEGNVVVEEYPPKRPSTIGEKIEGVGEAALTIGTGAIGGTVGMLAGTVKGLGDILISGEYGTQEGADKVAKAAEQYAMSITNMPESEEGKKYVQKLGDLLSQLPPIIGTGVPSAMASSSRAAMMSPKAAIKQGIKGATPDLISRRLSQSAQLKDTLRAARPDEVISLVDDIARSGADDAASQIRSVLDDVKPGKDIALKKLIDSKSSPDIQAKSIEIIKERQIAGSKGEGAAFKIKNEKVKADPVGRIAVKRGFPENEVQAIKVSQPQTKAKNLLILKRVKNGLESSNYKNEFPAAGIIGKSLLDRLKYVENVNKKAGSEVGAVAKTLKGKTVSIDKPLSSFMDSMESLGINTKTKNGNITLDFGTSTIQGLKSAQRPLSRAFNRLLGGGREGPTKPFDAYDAHNMKKWLDNIIQPVKGTPANKDVQRSIQALRADINEALRESFPKYKEANIKFSETVDPIIELKRLAGKNTDLSGQFADESLGTLSRRITSTAMSRGTVASSIKKIEDVANKYGGNFRDSIAEQQQFLNALEKRVGSQADTSLMGQQQAALEATGVAANVARGDIVGVGAKVVGKMFGKDGKKANIELIDAVESLLKN